MFWSIGLVTRKNNLGIRLDAKWKKQNQKIPKTSCLATFVARDTWRMSSRNASLVMTLTLSGVS